MRLIDADKLRGVMSVAKDEYGNVAESFFNMGGELSTEWWCVEDMLDNAETVEAIPVEWIEAEIKYLKALDFEFASLAAGQIEAMLKKWREEQKAPHCGPDYCDINFGGGTKA